MVGRLAHLRDPGDQLKKRSLQTMISGIPLVLGLENGILHPYAYVVFWGSYDLLAFLESFLVEPS